jgi:hypothetical protein
MKTTVDFDSPLFTPYLPDECQLNPTVYGAELAFWLSRKLAEQGVITSYPFFEDWGWFIEYIGAHDDEYWLCCANRGDAKDQWRCLLDPKAKNFFGRHSASLENAAPLLTALKTVLENEPEIRHISWSSE